MFGNCLQGKGDKTFQFSSVGALLFTIIAQNKGQNLSVFKLKGSTKALSDSSSFTKRLFVKKSV